ncbi:Predicted transcriptional regulator with C-terminal CBS domains [Maledivibacter halophilus]|uniref:Predicted transcriptional regulator with C-terminal CBS domains n=1 Tax=Maledivibacter halophilus TaxID=36842 RepID=A0A1T5JFR6_9FIRM|nr:Predicted transcriptional regulator with C-terminal CBS domains [Maledivibacter halophilus]
MVFTISDVGKKIRFLRKEQNLTQEELAGNQFTKSYISLIERGKINPSMKALNYIAEKLNKPVSLLLDTENSIVDSNNLYKISFIIEKGKKLVDNSEFNEALAEFTPLLNNMDNLTNYHKGLIYYYLGYIHFKKETSSKYLELIKKSINLFINALKNFEDNDPKDNLEIYIKLAECQYIMNSKNKSLNYFLEAKDYEEEHGVDLDNYFYILRNITILYTQKGNYSVAIDYLRKIINLSKRENIINEHVLGSYITLSTCYFFLEQYEDSLNTLEKILPVYENLLNNPKLHSGIYFRIAKAHIEIGNYDTALENINKSVEIAETIKEQHMKIFTLLYNRFIKSKIHFYEKDYDKAINETEKIIKELESINRFDNEYISLKADVYSLIGETLLVKNDCQKALEYLNMSLKLYTKIKAGFKFPVIYKLLGKAYIGLNDSKKAQEFYDKAFELLAKNKI